MKEVLFTVGFMLLAGGWGTFLKKKEERRWDLEDLIAGIKWADRKGVEF